MHNSPERPQVTARQTYLWLLLLLALSLAAFFPGLTTHGLTNWQEAMRCLVAREMQTRLAAGEPHALLVPTLHGEPYLAKPPLIYWLQIALAKVASPLGLGTISEWHLRMVAALAGTLGILLTYIVTRRLFDPWPAQTGPRDDPQPARPDSTQVALWASLFLAGGILYMRSARIGELDILLVPATLAAPWGVVTSWRHALRTGRTHIPAVIASAAACIAAALAKGPPALLVVALACYIGPIIHALRSPAAATAGRKSTRGGSLFWTLSKTHPVGVLGAGGLALFLWTRAVSHAIGPAKLSALVAEEATDNLRLLVPQAPLNNLEAMSYGVGLGSFFSIAAIIWLIKDRAEIRRLWSPGWTILIAWIASSFIAFSVLGKGVPRYLTPLWPAIAILGSLWWTSALRDLSWARRLARPVAILAVSLALAQSLWYGFGRERSYPARSPRAFIGELLQSPGVDASSLVAFEFWTPAVDFYAGQKVEGLLLDTTTDRPGLRYVGPQTLADLAARIRSTGKPATILLRLTQAPGMAEETAETCLKEAGFTLQPIPLQSKFIIDNNRVEIGAFQVGLTLP